METKTSSEWAQELRAQEGVVILDPDGWDRKNYDYSWYQEQIELSEFKKRLAKSTCIQSEDFKCSSISRQDS